MYEQLTKLAEEVRITSYEKGYRDAIELYLGIMNNKGKYSATNPSIVGCIMKALNAADEPLSAGNILTNVIEIGAKFKTERPIGTLRVALSRLEEEGKIKRVGRGLWVYCVK